MRGWGENWAEEFCALERFPLAPIQKGLLAESLGATNSGVNVEQIVWELDHVPDAARFVAAWQAAHDEFDALRLRFIWPAASKEPAQAVWPRVAARFERVDLSAPNLREQDLRLERFLTQDRSAGFDLSSVPLTRVSLVILGRSRAACVWSIHHSIIDGGAYALVLQRVFDHYAGRAPGASPQGVPRRPQFSDFLRWRKHHDTVPGTEHFAKQLRGFDDPTPLPLQEGLGLIAQNRTKRKRLRIGAGAAQKLTALAKETGSTPNTLVQLAWAILLSRHSGRADVVFGATWSGRPGTVEGAEQIVGPLITTLPVRVNLSDAETIRELITALRTEHLAQRPFQHTPLAQIKTASELARSAHLFQTLVVFEYERFYAQLQRDDSRWLQHRVWSRSQTGYPLVLAAWFEDGGLDLELEYDAGLYTPELAGQLLPECRRLLLGIGEHLDQSPFTLPMLEPAVRSALTWEEAERELAPASPVALERVVESSRKNPTRTAVEELGRDAVSYAELAQRVWRLSQRLQENGVASGALVAVLLPRSIEGVVALLAVHAAGAAFIPLDPRDPLERIAYILQDSRVTRLLVNAETRGRLARTPSLELDISEPANDAHDTASPRWVFPEPASPAYVIYTSGSTGEPKGVCVSHAALANHLTTTLQRFALSAEDRVLQFAALTFDVALEELLPTLAAGATIVLRSDEMSQGARPFFEAVAEQKISVLNLPTAFWHQLVKAHHLTWPACVRLLVIGGERASPEAHRAFREASTQHIRLLNAYGPTEATITSTCYDDAEGDHGVDGVPIGRPLPGVSHFVLDGHMRIVVPGAIGQLYIGGAGLAMGYLYRDEPTAQRFVAHPFRDGARLYATGDRVRKTQAGNYIYIDRIDNQVKVRGYRVELGEIEARLRRHPAVSEAAVVVHKQRTGDGSLVGFVIADSQKVSQDELYEHLAAGLPAHMLPTRLVISSSLATTISGKIDRVALAQIEFAESRDDEPPPSMTDSLVHTLMQIWTNVLGTPVASASSSFFDLGGHSLLAVQMFSEVEQRFGRNCNSAAFFRNPTIGHLAEQLRTAKKRARSSLTQLDLGDAKLQPLFLAPGLVGGGVDFVHVVRALTNDVPVYALQLHAFRDSERPTETLTDAARDLADRMQQAQPRGPYAIAGYSAAGVFALAIAEELHARGESMNFVGLIDCVPPYTVPIPSPLTSPKRMLRLSKTVAGHVRELLSGPDLLPRIWPRVRSAALRSAARWKLLDVEYRPTVDEMFEDASAIFSARDQEGMQRYLDAIVGHQFGAVQLDVVLFRTPLDPFEGPHEYDLGWRRVTSGKVTVEQVDGTHSSVLTAAGCQGLAARFELHLAGRAWPRPPSTADPRPT